MLPKFKLFPSPYSGILFLLADALGYDIVFKKFPSPYSGILFLWTSKKMMGNSKIQVFVPLFGDSFFIRITSSFTKI